MKLSFFKEVRRITPYLFGTFVLFLVSVPGVFAVAGDGASSGISLLDTNANGKIDRITFSIANPNTEAFTLAGVAPYDLSVTQSGVDITISAVTLTTLGTANPVGIQVDLNEADGDLLVNTNGVLTGAVELIYTSDGDADKIWDTVDEQLNAIATGDTGATDTEADGAKPVISNFQYLDNDGDGKIDRIITTFSEQVAAASSLSAANLTFTNDGDFNDAAFGPDATDLITGLATTATIDLGTEATPVDTKEDSGTIAISTAGVLSLTDGTNNYTTAGPQAQATFTDGAGPILISAQTLDVGLDGTTYNGKVDHLKLTFSENIDDSAINNYAAGVDYTPTSLAVANVTNEKVDADEILADAEDNAILYIIFDEDAGICSVSDQTGCDTSAVDQDITWTGASVTIKDIAGTATGNLAGGGVVEADTAAPYITGANYYDNNANGVIDYTVLVFSESVNDADYLDKTSTISAGGVLTTAAIVAAGTVALDAAANDKWITLAIAGGAANTTNITATLNTVAADMIEDANNISSLNQAAVTLTDKAAPFLVSAQTLDGGADGSTPNGKIDHMKLTFSEAIDDSAINNYNGAVDYTPTTLALAAVSNEKVDAGEYPGDAEDDSTLTIVFDEDAGVCSITDQSGCDTEAVDQDITWTGGSITITDAAANATGNLAGGGVVEADTAKPFIVGGNYYDNDANGVIDYVVLVFSESVSDADYLDKASTISTGGTLENNAIVAATTVALDAAADDEYITFDILGGTANTTNITATFDTVAVDMIEDAANNSSWDQDTVTLYDEAAPIYVSSQTLDENGDGLADFVKVTYSEPVSDASVAAGDYAAGLIGVGVGALVESFAALTPAADVANDAIIYVGVADGTDDILAATTNYTIHIAQIGAVDDASANSLASFVEKTSTDGAGPILLSANTLDVGNDGATANGKVDHLVLTFSEAIDDSAINGYLAGADYTPNTLAIANVAGEAVDGVEILGDVEDNAILYIIFTEDVGACSVSDQTGCDTSTVDQDITWTGASVTFQDLIVGNAAGNLAAGGVVEADSAAPFILGANYYDDNTDGTIDNLVLVFSENVTDADYLDKDSTISAGGTLTNAAIVAAGTIPLDAAADDKWITLAIAGGAANTTNIGVATFDTVAVDMIEDANNNSSLDQAAVTLTDKAAPVLVGASYEDATGDGQVDQVNVTFSENITLDEYDDTDFAVTTPGDLTLQDETAAAVQGGNGASAILNISALGDAGETSSAAAPVMSYTAANGTADSLTDGSNPIADFSTGTIDDGAKPVVLSAQTLDIGLDGTTYNGKVDHLKLTFSEAIDDSAINNYAAGVDYAPTSLAVANVSNEIVDAVEILGDVEDNAILYIIFDEDGGACSVSDQSGCDTSAVDQDITWTGGSVTIQDDNTNAAGNLVGGGVVETDKANPYIVGANYYDNNGNGVIDNTVIVFSENVSDASYLDKSSTISAGGTLTTAAIVAAATVALDAAANDKWITLAIAGGAANTTNITATLNTVAADMIDDANGNSSLNQAAVTLSDKAAPIVMTKKYLDNNSDGQVDRVQLTLTEAFVANTANLGDFAYTANDITASVLAGGAVAYATPVVTLTLGTPGNDNITSHTTAPQIAYTDDAGREISDAAGNQLATFGAVDLADGAGPVVTGVTGAFGGTAATATFSEGVWNTAGAAGAIDASDLTYNNVSANGAGSISGVVHVPGATTAALTLNANLISLDSNDTLKDAAASVYDTAGNAGGNTSTANMVVTGVDGSFVLKNGWNAFSTPKKLSAITFSNGGTNITYYGLASGVFSSVVANTANVTPLTGFLVNNTTGSDVTVDLVYSTGLTPPQKLFDKTLSAGWNLMGVANTANAATNNGTTTGNVGTGENLVDSLGTQLSEAIDFTGTVGALGTATGFDVGVNKGGVAFTTTDWSVKNKSYFSGATGDFANGKAYGIFIKSGGAVLSGHQN